ncbi:hypothetical protein [Kitasatospora purpeofusca]|uniref:hypothetical protein n=1 Tax=Kitasatospora purpeofusca TaxID=67352 RepID=UPI0012FEBE4D|nr:hypothetical protein [Kitasatospora purpeofusca]
MPRHTFGEAMPPHLRSAAIQYTMETVDDLREVLQYSAPVLAGHGWARMCMYRTADAMDTMGFLVDEIALHLEDTGVGRGEIRRLLAADRECLRTERPARVAGSRYTKEALHVMPRWVADELQDALTYVLLRLPVMLRSAVRARDTLWVGRCLRPLVDSMDRLGRLANLFAAVHVDVYPESALSWYQQLFQQRSRVTMPDVQGRHFRAAADWGDLPVCCDSYEVKVSTLLVMLDEQCDGRRWEGHDGRTHPAMRNAAVGTLNAVAVVTAENGDGPRYRLTDDEWGYAEAVSAALRSRLARSFPDPTEGDRPLLDVLRAAFQRTPRGSAMTLRLLCLLVAVLLSTVAALLVFILRSRLGVRVSEAVLWAGSAFGGSMVVVLGALVFVFGG